MRRAERAGRVVVFVSVAEAIEHNGVAILSGCDQPGVRMLANRIDIVKFLLAGGSVPTVVIQGNRRVNPTRGEQA